MAQLSADINAYPGYFHGAIGEFFSIRKHQIKPLTDQYLIPMTQRVNARNKDGLEDLLKGVCVLVSRIDETHQVYLKNYFPTTHTFLFSTEMDKTFYGFSLGPIPTTKTFLRAILGRIAADSKMFHTLMWYETVGRAERIHTGVNKILKGDGLRPWTENEVFDKLLHLEMSSGSIAPQVCPPPPHPLRIS